jgi:hypothetical protein
VYFLPPYIVSEEDFAFLVQGTLHLLEKLGQA